jgi:hypothetical protein
LRRPKLSTRKFSAWKKKNNNKNNNNNNNKKRKKKKKKKEEEEGEEEEKKKKKIKKNPGVPGYDAVSLGNVETSGTTQLPAQCHSPKDPTPQK